MYNAIFKYFFTLTLSLLISYSVFGNNGHQEVATQQVTKQQKGEHIANTHEKGTDIVEVILHHVSDANEHHVATIGGKHISIPLPCILYNKQSKKIDVFTTSTFHHAPNGIHAGYKMEHGKVVDAATGKRDTFIDFSITKNVFHMLLTLLILTLVMFVVRNSYTKNKNQAPRGIQAVIEPVIQYLIDDVFKPNLGNKYEKFLPFLLSLFFFILLNNLLGLVPFFPGSANASGNIAFTFTLAFFTFLVVNLNGNKHYWQHVFAMPGVPKLVLIILTPIEILGLFIKPIALMLRLFGNITGGHIAVLSIVSIIFILGEMGKNIGGSVAGMVISVPVLLFVNAMELFVAFLQAYVFTLLSSIFIGMAVEDHGHHDDHH